MYESPISEMLGKIQTKIIEQQENQIVQAVQNCGISVDKEELIKALMYDRQQYEKGYADAKAEMRWISASERLPELGQLVLVTSAIDGDIHLCTQCATDGQMFIMDGTRYHVLGEAWMPLPEPYKPEPKRVWDGNTMYFQDDDKQGWTGYGV